MIAVDTNLLVYAHRREAPFHDAARGLMSGLASGRDPWAIPWPCVHEFLANVTHRRIYRTPTALPLAIRQVEQWVRAPTATLLAEDEDYWTTLAPLLESSQVAGPVVHDARVAAICLCHGVSELWTADRDFSRFPALRSRNPLLG